MPRETHTITLSEADTSLWRDPGDAGDEFRSMVRGRARSEVALVQEPIAICTHTGASLEVIEPAPSPARESGEWLSAPKR